jgi:hypothetical protein
VRGILAAFIVMTLCGCTTMRIVGADDLRAVAGALQPGDRVAVRADSDDTWNEDLTVVRVTDTSIQTRDPQGLQETFGMPDIAEMRVRRRAPGKTIALALGIYFGSLYALCGNPFNGHEDGC